MSTMPTTSLKNVGAIFCGDIHLRDTTPICRTDDYVAAMLRKLSWIKEVSENWFGVPLFIAGDVFHHWKPSPWLLSQVMNSFPEHEGCYCIAGQHDLPQHAMNRITEAGLETLARAERVSISPEGLQHEIGGVLSVYGANFGQTPPCKDPFPDFEGRKALMLHEMVYQDKSHLPYPGAPAEGRSKAVLKRYPWADLIVCGDNHEPFTVTLGKRVLVNCGSMMRSSADQKNHKPSIWAYDPGSNEVERVYIPIEKGVVSREHIEKREERDEKMEAFVSRVQQDYEVGLSFRRNLKQHIAANTISSGVKEILKEVV